jgi:WD40 repeat protein
VCNITFTDTAGNIAINTTNSSMYITNPARVTGWGLRSVVKMYGDNASSLWPESYPANAIVGLASQPNVTTPTRTNLIDANSNAINISGTPLRTTSNLLLYIARTDSSSLWVLRSRADSSNISIRTTSNAVNLIYQIPTANSIDGSIFPRYVTNHYVFHNGAWTARGWVRFNNGFTVMPQAVVSMDTLTTVSGGFDLRDTGVLKLNNDLYLSHNVTLTTGGYIKGNAANYGQANTIFMGGDLALSSISDSPMVIHITGDWANGGQSGDTVIDGGGHTLTIGDYSQIFVDQNVTLTLRNMTIKTNASSLTKPAIQLASLGSKLALDNVLLDLGADFHFLNGQLFIHDEVAVTGTSAFVYNSPRPSYITSGATWSFESGTTFSIAPATYTDQPYTAGTATSNNFIVLADQSAALSLNNCSLKTTFTGARLSQGMVLFDNKVAIDTQAGVDISGLGAGTGLLSIVTTCSCVSFSPDGRYVAVGYTFNGSEYLSAWQFNGSSPLTAIGNLGYASSSPAMPAVAWSPDGKFIATGSDQGLHLYRFTGTALTNFLAQPFGILVNSIAWSPDGRYLAVGGNNGTTPLIVYSFNGTSLTPVTTANPGNNTIQVNGVAWTPDGKYLAMATRGQSSVGAVYVYAFNGASLSLTSIISGGPGNGTSVAWSPDGRFFVFGWDNSGIGYGYITAFNGTSSFINFYNCPLGTQVNAVSFSPNGRYLLLCGVNTGSGQGTYALYAVNYPNAVLLSQQTFGTVATTVAWSPDSRYVLVGGTNTGSNYLTVYPTNFVEPASNTQGFSNGLLFGNKALGAAQGLGSAYDANVQVLSSATVKVKGKIKDDSF